MVYRGGRNPNRFNGGRNPNRFNAENNDEEEEEIDLRNFATAGEATRLREAQYLAEEALRMAKEARDAIRRLNEFRARLGLPDHRCNVVAENDGSTIREGDDSCRC